MAQRDRGTGSPYSPSLADKVTVSTADASIEEIAAQIAELVLVGSNEELKPLYKRVLDKFKRKDVVIDAFKIATAATKAIEEVQKALPPGTFGN